LPPLLKKFGGSDPGDLRLSSISGELADSWRHNEETKTEAAPKAKGRLTKEFYLIAVRFGSWRKTPPFFLQKGDLR
jgi:hypothetical protein